MGKRPINRDEVKAKIKAALHFYGNPATWKTSTRWAGGGFSTGEEPEGMQPYECLAALEEDKGKLAREALAAIKAFNHQKPTGSIEQHPFGCGCVRCEEWKNDHPSY